MRLVVAASEAEFDLSVDRISVDFPQLLFGNTLKRWVFLLLAVILLVD
ncbi:MAG TPA: hypothetical protein VFV18_08285 [Porticoccaceae bacterium]|nr:hypothetical protein [Porticoccaceae bacterium]